MSPDRNGEMEDKSLLPRPNDVFISGKVQTWTPEAYPYIGGGFSSPIAGGRGDYPSILSSPHNENIFFCGEASSTKAGGTAHAALESGLHAAKDVARYLISTMSLVSSFKSDEKEELVPETIGTESITPMIH